MEKEELLLKIRRNGHRTEMFQSPSAVIGKLRSQS